MPSGEQLRDDAKQLLRVAYERRGVDRKKGCRWIFLRQPYSAGRVLVVLSSLRWWTTWKLRTWSTATQRVETSRAAPPTRSLPVGRRCFVWPRKRVHNTRSHTGGAQETAQPGPGGRGCLGG